MSRLLIALLLSTISLSAFSAEGKFSFAGHVTLKNDVPAPIQLTMFEGDFVQAPEDEDTAAMKEALQNNGMPVMSDIFYAVKNEKPNIIIMLINDHDVPTILILDLEKQAQYKYNVSVMEEKRIISRKEGFSDYILEVK